MKKGYLIKDQQERFNMKRGWIVNAWRIVNEKGQDMIQPWSSTKKEAMETAKQCAIEIIGDYKQ